MWKAKLKKKRLIDGNLSLVIEYKEGAKIVTESYNTKDGGTSVKQIAMERIAELNSLSDKYNEIDAGAVIDLTSPTPTPSPVLTPNEVKRQAYNRGIFDLKRKSELVDLGVLTEGEAGLSDLRNTVKTLGVELREI